MLIHLRIKFHHLHIETTMVMHSAPMLAATSSLTSAPKKQPWEEGARKAVVKGRRMIWSCLVSVTALLFNFICLCFHLELVR